jgi:hypothetical protein
VRGHLSPSSAYIVVDRANARALWRNAKILRWCDEVVQNLRPATEGAFARRAAEKSTGRPPGRPIQPHGLTAKYWTHVAIVAATMQHFVSNLKANRIADWRLLVSLCGASERPDELTKPVRLELCPCLLHDVVVDGKECVIVVWRQAGDDTF